MISPRRRNGFHRSVRAAAVGALLAIPMLLSPAMAATAVATPPVATAANTAVAATPAAPPAPETAGGSAIAEAAGFLVDELEDTWRPGEFWVDPMFSRLVTDRDRELVEPLFQQAEAAGLPVRIAVVPPVETDYDAYLDSHAYYQRAALDYRERTGLDRGILVFLEANSTFEPHLTVFSDTGARHLNSPYVDGVADSTLGPAAHFAIRSALAIADGQPLPEPVAAEREARTSVLPPEAGLAGTSPFNLVMVLSIAGTGVALFVLYLVVRAGLALRERRGGRRGQLEENEEEGLRHALLREANAAQRRVQNASGDASAAAEILPRPGETSNLLVQAAWVTLGRALRRGTKPASDFFDPSQSATTTRFFDEINLEVPVGSANAKLLDEGGFPRTLNADGWDTGAPYWHDGDSPFARSGFGAFSSLPQEIIAAADDGRFSAADAVRAHPPMPTPQKITRPGTAARTASRPLSPWKRLVAVMAAALVVGIPLGFAASGFIVSEYQRTVSPYTDYREPRGAISEDWLSSVSAGLGDDGVYVHPAFRLLISASDEQAIAEEVAKAESPRALVVAVPDSVQSDFDGDSTMLVDAILDANPEAVVIEPSGALSSYSVSGGRHRPEDRALISEASRVDDDAPERTPAAAIADVIAAIDRTAWSEDEHYSSDDYSEPTDEEERYPVIGSAEHTSRTIAANVLGIVLGTGLLAIALLILARLGGHTTTSTKKTRR